MHRGFSVRSAGIFRESAQQVMSGNAGRIEVSADLEAHDACEQKRLELEVGEAARLSLPFRAERATWRLLRKPTGSATVIAGATLTAPDLPGVYTVVCELTGGWRRELELCATYLDATEDAEAKREARRQFRCWLNDPERTTAEVIALLERPSAGRPQRRDVNVPDRQALAERAAERAVRSSRPVATA